MEKLLNWSIANQSEDKETRAKAGAPDPELLAQLFGAAADEPTLMKQNMAVISNEEATLENREIAFDNFEMLIENMDNANNIKNLQLWEPLTKQLNSEHDSLVKLTCSVIGTAVQNNPESQEAFLNLPKENMEILIELSKSSKIEEIKLKSLYALSNIIRHNEKGYKIFNESNGWIILAPILNSSDSSDKLKLRCLSLISALLSTGITDEKKNYLQKDYVVKSMLTLLHSETHIGCVDKVLNILNQLVSNKYEFNKDEIDLISKAVIDIEKIKEKLSEDDFQSIKSVVK
ncbi:unnamed protein product [[Candida] boidinii]|nr:hypothetical protein B5S30_g5793 [[Candida] boidinii]OWB86655.1 hypothetical protein B5S33_g5363 [[Candida] boidinii]GME91887.1 unnamed protein product [[Candida] boidinii]GMG07556.1 unnamed protein product [[Candida] boidinii]